MIPLWMFKDGKAQELVERLQEEMICFCAHLAEVTCLLRLPQEEKIDLFLQACEEVGALLDLQGYLVKKTLENLPEQPACLLKRILENLPEQLMRLVIEAQVLRQERERSIHTIRTILEQQGKVKRAGQECLHCLGVVQALLHLNKSGKTMQLS